MGGELVGNNSKNIGCLEKKNFVCSELCLGPVAWGEITDLYDISQMAISHFKGTSVHEIL